jgi:hypothetical protein
MAKGREKTESHAAVELPARLVFSLLTAAVRIAARVEMPLGRLTDLLRTAYFLEHRRRHPRDLAAIAQKLGVSLRTAGTLNRTLRDDFFDAETEVEPIRQVTLALLGHPRSPDALLAETGLDPDALARALDRLRELRWIEDEGEQDLKLAGSFRSFLDTDLDRRIDGVNHQLGVIANSVWFRFAQEGSPRAGGRSWTFAAREEDVAAAMERVFGQLRQEAIRMEDDALREGASTRYGITVAFAPLEEEG